MAKYANEFKKEIAELRVHGGRTVDSLKDEYGISHVSILKWTTAYRNELRAQDYAEYESKMQKLDELQQALTEMEEENAKLKEKNDFLTKIVKNLCRKIN